MKILAAGCSFTKGMGLDLQQHDPRLWVNQLLHGHSVTNLAKGGRNNNWIFLATMSALITDRYDLVLVGWTSIPRYCVHVGLETWSVHTMLRQSVDINLHGKIKFTGRWLDQLGSDLDKIHNDHWDLLDLVKYVNVLAEIQHSRGSKIIFVNSLGPWSSGFFDRKIWQTPDQLSAYEQDLLDVQNRSDDQVHELYDMIHTQYDQYGGIRPDLWLNLNQSLRSMQVDQVSLTDQHPGYQSQDEFVRQLGPQLQAKLKY